MAHARYDGHSSVIVSVNASGRWGADCICSWSSEPERSYSTGSEAFTAWEQHVRESYVEPEPIPMVDIRGDAGKLTTDPADPRLSHGVDTEPKGQAEVYLILSDEERAKGFVRPVRRSYIHNVCGTSTRMSQPLAETYARDPKFYGATFCAHCNMHRPVGEHGEFVWEDGTKVGT